MSLMPVPGQPANSGVPKLSETLLRSFESLPGLSVDAVSLVDGLSDPLVFCRGNVTYRYFPCKARGKTATLYLAEIAVLKKIIAELDPQIVHAQPTPEYLLAATICHRPSILSVHGFAYKESSATSMFSPVRMVGVVRELLQYVAVARAKNVFSMTEYLDHYLKRVSSAKIWRTHNPVGMEFFQLPPPRREGMRIICVGTVSARKNQELLIRACAQLAKEGVGFECRVIGRKTETADILVSLVEKMNISDRVQFLSSLSNDEVAAQYEWANVVVLPSLEETCPLSLMQAMACGRCVFGADAAGIPFLLKDQMYGTLFDPHDSNSLVSMIRCLLERPDVFWMKAGSAREYAVQHFVPDAIAKRTLEIYSSLVS
ncbi:MAG: hypothetical protein A2283_11950 [Lentisphaerae bacterium RIFOXYA12_FULL_48_11]|nr:MAG: hypothetical protein A2283_11950 [Lentisphaerae bacterium RIFOXYA12_FULL_48_11]